MKKSIILGGLLISTLTFARGNNPQDGMGRNFQNKTQTNISALSNEQLAKLDVLRKESFENHEKQRVEIEGKNIEIEKLLAEENINWTSVKKLTKEVSELEAKLDLDMLKMHEQVKEVTGEDFPQLGMRMNFDQDNVRDQGNRQKGNGNFGNQDQRGMMDENNQGRGNRQNTKSDDRGNQQQNRGRNTGNMGNINNQNSNFSQNRYANLTDDQIAKIQEIHLANRIKNDKLELGIASNDNKIAKELLDENVNWSSIEKLVLDSAEIKANIRLNNFAEREAIEEVTGKEIIRVTRNGRNQEMRNGNRGLRN